MEAVILAGIQGSGKSTFYRERFFDTHRHISLDVLGSRRLQELAVRECIALGQPFVVDNTNPRAEDRAPHIAAAKTAHFRVVGYFFDTPVKAALRRNARRERKAIIPVPGVIGTFKKLQPPAWSEGFDELYRVTHAPGTDAFLVTPEPRP